MFSKKKKHRKIVKIKSYQNIICHHTNRWKMLKHLIEYKVKTFYTLKTGECCVLNIVGKKSHKIDNYFHLKYSWI